MRHFRTLLKTPAARSWLAGAAVVPAALGVYAAQQNQPSECKEARKLAAPEQFLYTPLSKDSTPRDSIEFDTSAPMRKRMEAMIFRVQDQIVAGIEEVDGKKFRTDEWEREGHGGGGRSRILQDGNVFEKAGVGVSVVHGSLPPAAIKQMKSRGKDLEEGKDLPFYACGVSLVMHPRNPMAPTIHLNYRFFEVETGRLDADGKPQTLSWFGGGADLTPSFLFEEDARHFHAVYKIQLDKRDPKLYPEMKEACDKYFYIPHRKEGRGVGGFFFDDMEDTCEESFQMIRNCANSMLDSYLPILLRRKDMPFTEKQKEWQQIRRGRYVEFNVMYDRGTKFGLATPGSRIESILMSLPLTARWEYMNSPEKGSWEDRTLQVLKSPVDWLNVPEVDLEKLSTAELLQEIARRSEK
ncbi:Coproporphyrinogen iii oxidase, partial [Globisporangium splendens]